jgi:hypothetical protein
VAVDTLVGVETGGGGVGAHEVKIDLTPPGVPKVSIFPLFCIFRAALRKAPEPSKFCFFLLELKKELYGGIFARRLL